MYIYSYKSISDFIIDLLKRKQSTNPSFSLRSWAKRLGYNGPSYVSKVMSRQKRSNIELVNKLSLTENIVGKEKRYLMLLHFKDICKTSEERMVIDELLDGFSEDLRPSISIDQFEYISNWYSLSIVEIIGLKFFHATKENIIEVLRGQVLSNEVAESLDRLVRIGLLEIVNDVYRRKDDVKPVVVDPLQSSLAVKSFHLSSLDKAKIAILDQDSSIRDYRSSLISLKEEDFIKAKGMIYECHKNVLSMSAKNNEADRVYQFSSQFYRIV